MFNCMIIIMKLLCNSVPVLLKQDDDLIIPFSESQRVLYLYKTYLSDKAFQIVTI